MQRSVLGDFISSADMAEYTAFLGRHYILAAVWVCALVGLVYVQIRILTAGIKKLSSAKCTFLVNHENGLFVDKYDTDSFNSARILKKAGYQVVSLEGGIAQWQADNLPLSVK